MSFELRKQDLISYFARHFCLR